MLIKIGYDIQLRPKSPTAIIFLLRVHPSRRVDLVADERFALSLTFLSKIISTLSAITAVECASEIPQSVSRTKP
jgi:hypothetical protein